MPLPSDSNDTWRIGGTVLRVCWRGDLARFRREAAVAAALPPGFPYPEVLDAGSDGELAWQLTRAVEGVPLVEVWHTLTAARRRAAVHRLGAALALLHEHRFPAQVVELLTAPRRLDGITDVIGADIVPLPLDRALRLLDAARGIDGVPAALLDRVAERLHGLTRTDPLSAPPAGSAPAGIGCLHGDAHPGNALWHEDEVVALLDLEWVRFGPADLELEPYLRDNLGTPAWRTADTREVLRLLAESHPAAFAPPDLVDRLSLYRLVAAVRSLVIAGRTADADPRPLPLAPLSRAADGDAHIRRLLPDGGRR
ncbi:phosphotransferase family enzyme [Allonocardiopsis opalescens]|uniref:Phosphotransferase family enzyme n=1 Tax=Allonocardiopsis opalescens TaxID=1144618 RepID=A0A2T0PM87_9ACTN|nr:phosphotransferase family enzyme [Allonocardiopsis opalescens]